MSENVREKNFSAEKAKALGALLLSGNNKHAATMAGVNERTVRRWRSEPDFQEAIEESIQCALEGFNMVLASSVGPAALKLHGFVSSGTATPAQQLRAAIALADLALRAQELTIRKQDLAMRQAFQDEFAARLAAVEAKVK